MSDLTTRESELVALGAALGSNCVPCIDYHIPHARKVGLKDQEIHAAIRLADKVRQVPARKVLEAALNLLQPAAGNHAGAESAGPIDGCTGGTGYSKGATRAGTEETIDCMAAMMAGMMSSCGRPASAAGDQSASSSESEASDPEGGRGCC